MYNKSIDCQQQKLSIEAYDVGGTYSNLGNYTDYVKTLKQKYSDSVCGKDPLMEKCLERELYLKNLQNTITVTSQQNLITQSSAWAKVLLEETKKYNDLGCNAKVQESRNVVVKEKLNKYNALDKQRIEAESKFQANKKIFIGGSFILVAIAVILVIRTK